MHRATPAGRGRVVILGLLLSGAGVIAALALAFLTIPYLWTAVLFSLLFLVGFLTLRGTTAGVLCMNVALIGLVLAAFEGYTFLLARRALVHDDAVDSRGEHQRGMPDDVLGFVPKPDRHVVWTRHVGEALVFQVQYTIGADRLRIAPPASPGNTECVLFFGDSFTFGAGVNDEDTMPYRAGVLLAGRYRTYNLGFSGYGPQQTLAALEAGIVERIGCQPRYAVFLAIVDHARRVSRPQSRRGPRYVLQADGAVIRQGSFDDQEVPTPWGRAVGAIDRQLRKSYLVSRLIFQPWDARTTADNMDLLVAVLNGARVRLEGRSPTCEFHVLFWDEPASGANDGILARLNAGTFRVHRISDILPRFRQDRAQYELSPYDPHPNRLAYRLIADYVASQIVYRTGAANSTGKN